MSNKGHSNSGNRSHGMSHQGIINARDNFIDNDDNNSGETKKKNVRCKCAMCEKWMSEKEYYKHQHKCYQAYKKRKGFQKMVLLPREKK